jgi:putative ABC transport system permease protein
MAPGNDRTTIVTFAVIALLILGMAVVNFTNLATARASQRAREVALRKVLGANRKPADRPVHRRIDPHRRRWRC